MTYPISSLEGMTAFAASQLKSLGIRTTDGLLEAAGTVKGRKVLAARTGIKVFPKASKAAWDVQTSNTARLSGLPKQE